ncbi:lipid droplet-regulating VLDL assembly factor AUP1-like isoform X2 [Centruroides vittatus]|uniref:lipid droplet-regulating VLDL assembly factor AUP1-like isoform X2 n=1 Tax=Centruroides vittatus TaxID=120091 RepID=UPI00350FC033
MSSAGVSLDRLFHLHRFQKTIDYFPLFFYFPFGISLAVVRFFIGCHAFLAACILPKSSAFRRFVLRSICFVLGIVVRQENCHYRAKQVKVIISNHITILDHLAVDLVLSSILPSVWDLPNLLSWLLGFKDLGVKKGRDVLLQNVKKHTKEGATTNGNVGLLKFSTWPFSLDQPVQPVLITVSRLPLLDISPSTLDSRWWSDIFWFLFTPFTFFTLRYLPYMDKKPDETTEEFARRVQYVMAHELGIKATCFTCVEKVAYATRKLCLPLTSFQQQNEINLNEMINQVKGVLPNVPLDLIRHDLIITKNVDLTISRILEGSINYIPELKHLYSLSQGSEKFQKTKCLCDAVAKDLPALRSPSTNSTTDSFKKSSKDRIKLYEERKAQLIKNARMRYINKHCVL